MTVEDAILAAIAAEDSGKLVGRTLLQKKLYFLSLLLRQDWGFHPHYYGPYSQTVSNALGALVDAGFIKEEIDTFSTNGNGFGEGRRYTYYLRDGSREMLDKLKEEFEPITEKLRRVNSHVIADDSRLLPVAAKVHYIEAEHGAVTKPKIMEYARELGWNLSSDDIDQVVEYLKCLDFPPGAETIRTQVLES